MKTISEIRNAIAKKQTENATSTAERDWYLGLIDDLARHIEKLEATAPTEVSLESESLRPARPVVPPAE